MERSIPLIRPVGIRLRLTFLYTAIFAVVVLIFGVVIYFALNSALTTNFDQTLRLRTQAIAAGISSDGGTICIQDTVVGLPGLVSNGTAGACGTGEGNNAGQTNQTPNVDVATLVRVVNDQHQIVYVSPEFRRLSVPTTSVSAPLTSGNARLETISAQGGQQVRIYSLPLSDNGNVYGVLQVGDSLAPLNTTLRAVATTLGIVAPLALLLGALSSYTLAGRALRPIQRLTSTARTIEVEDLHQRVPIPAAKDEVRSLALTLNAMIARLESAFARERRFVADASHELRTPVAVIQSLAEITLAQATSPHEYTTALGDIRDEAQRLGSLVADLLVLARADEGRLPLDRDPVRLDLLAADVIASVEPLATERRVSLHAETLEPATVIGDAARLIQVMLNLVDNALAYTDGGGSVTVSVLAAPSFTRFIVHDTGIGMTAEEEAHIFERFYRADPARRRVAGGSGLGLAIVDWVVRAHGGSVAVASAPGRGSTFTVTLPNAPSFPAPNPPPRRRAIPGKS